MDYDEARERLTRDGNLPEQSPSIPELWRKLAAKCGGGSEFVVGLSEICVSIEDIRDALCEALVQLDRQDSDNEKLGCALHRLKLELFEHLPYHTEHIKSGFDAAIDSCHPQDEADPVGDSQ